MGVIPAIVYVLLVMVFVPFPFYKDIVAATSGGGNRDVVLPEVHVETGRFLHRFPHSKVVPLSDFLCSTKIYISILMVLTSGCKSLRRICLACSLYSPLSYSASATTSWTFGGATRC